MIFGWSIKQWAWVLSFNPVGEQTIKEYRRVQVEWYENDLSPPDEESMIIGAHRSYDFKAAYGLVKLLNDTGLPGSGLS